MEIICQGGIDKLLTTTYCAYMTPRQFAKSVTDDLNIIVRLQRERERKEVCWVCSGTGRDMYGIKCVYCGGRGLIHVEVRQ